MKVDVLLVVDNAYRELPGLTIIKYYLEGMGYTVRFTSRFSIRFALAKYRPKMVILTSAIYPYIPELSKVSFVCVLPSESGNGQRRQVIDIHGGTFINKLYTKNVDMFFSWGEQMSDWLIESGIYQKEQVYTTGNPSTDQWMIKRERKINSKVGLTSTLRSLANSMDVGSSDFIKYLFESELNGGDGTYFSPPNHIEAWLHWEVSFLRVICNLTHELIIPNNIQLEIRPHPFESIEKYSYLIHRSKNLISVRKEGPITDWFQNIDLLITYMSASAVDAFVYGIPVLSLKKILNQDALRNVPQGFIYDYYDYFWEPDNIESLRECIQENEKGNLPLAPKLKELEEYIQRQFNFPRAKPAGQLIAESIDSFFKKNKSRDIKNIPSSLHILNAKADLFWKLPLSEETVLFLNALREKFIGIGNRSGFHYTYHPWNSELKNKSKKILEQLLKSL